MEHTNHSCSHCSHELTLLKGRFDDYGYCPECFNFEGKFRYEGKCCNKPELVMVKHTIRDGRFQIKKQCYNCGMIQGPCYPFKTVENIEDLTISSRVFQDNLIEARSEEFLNMRMQVLKMFQEKSGVHTDKEGPLLEYAEYLKSPEWKEKRKMVMQRDKYICQSCLVEDAREVHHLTYRHLYNEPLFDLVAVCRDCHQSITDMDNKSEYKKIVHQNLLETILIRQLGL